MATVPPQSLRSSRPDLAIETSADASLCDQALRGEAALEATSTQSQPEFGPIVGPSGWKRRLEDPFNTYYRYPVALVIVRALVRTPVTPNQVSFAQPLLAALAGYLITFDDYRHLVLAVLAFEVRSILDCVDGSLARAKRMSSPYGHAIDAVADWVGVVLLFVGILMHFRLHPPQSWLGLPGFEGAPTVAAVTIVMSVSGAQAGLRSFSFDYFKTKYLSIYESGRDACMESLRAKICSNKQHPSVFGYIDVFIGRLGYLVFEREWFDPERSCALTKLEIDALSNDQDSRTARRMGFLWSISGGDAFLSQVMLTILIGQMWAGQIFFAVFGTAWILAVISYNIRFVRTGRRLTPAPVPSTAIAR